jgi:hypothetical protein
MRGSDTYHLPACQFNFTTRVVARSWIRSPSELMHSEVVKEKFTVAETPTIPGL